MMDLPISKCLLVSHPAVYRIRVPGRLDSKWSGFLQGMAVTVFEEANQETFTELTGLLLDQAALMGVLQQLYNRNIPLLSVECITTSLKKK